jgi:hypothetical protein
MPATQCGASYVKLFDDVNGIRLRAQSLSSSLSVPLKSSVTQNYCTAQAIFATASMPELTGDPKQHEASKFADSISGSCLCGSITVTITDSELFSKPRGHLCHCSNCRKVAGSFVSSNLLIEEDKVKIEDRDGTLKVYEDRATGSGNPVYRFFCSKDGK